MTTLQKILLLGAYLIAIPALTMVLLLAYGKCTNLQQASARQSLEILALQQRLDSLH